MPIDDSGDAVISGAPFGVLTLDRDGRIRDVNAAGLVVFERAAEDVVGARLVAFVAPRERPMVADALDELDRGRRRVTVEHRIEREAEPAWCRTTLTRAVGSSATTAYLEDVTEHREAVLLLRQTERQYRSAFEGSPIGQAICTLDGVIVHANRALARILGLDVPRLLGGRLNDHALDASPINEPELVALVRGTVPSLEAERRFRHASGAEVHAHVHLTLRRDRAGQPAELLVGLTDVTRRAVAERDRAAALARLQDALADLERSNGDLEHFASVASHDLRAPLTTVIGFLRTLDHQERAQLSARARTYVAAALRGTERMESMLGSLLEHAGRRRAPMHVGPVDLHEVVRGAVNALSADIAAAGASVHTGPLPVVEADGPSLDIVFQNLLANAIKFRRPDRPPSVSVSARSVGDTWQLRVEDNGIGVPPEQREAIFELFARREEVAAYEGHGIGLATVARAVARHDGRVWVEDGSEGGACFVLALPRTTVRSRRADASSVRI